MGKFFQMIKNNKIKIAFWIVTFLTLAFLVTVLSIFVGLYLSPKWDNTKFLFYIIAYPIFIILLLFILLFSVLKKRYKNGLIFVSALLYFSLIWFTAVEVSVMPWMELVPRGSSIFDGYDYVYWTEINYASLLGIIIGGGLPAIISTMVWNIFNILKTNTQNILNIERTPQQKEWFLQSKIYKEMPNENAKFKKTIWIFYASIIGWLLLPFIWFQMVVIGRKSKKNFETDNANLYKTCIKCGKENIDILEKKFIRTYYDNKTVKQPASYSQRFDDNGWGGITDGKYKPKYEIVNVDHIKEYYNKTGKVELMAIYTLKKTHHEYEITRKCPQCEYLWTTKEDLPNPPNSEQPQVNINIENYHEVKKDLPFVYCGHCGGKNKGESLYCVGCGATLSKLEK